MQENNKNIYVRCREFYYDSEYAKKLRYPANPRTLEALGLYPFFIPIEQPEGPEIVINHQKFVMIGSNNYLGMTTHPKVKEAAVRAIKKYGTSCTGSRLLNGTLDIHLELEEKLADFVGKEKALVFSTGFQTNLGTITSLIGNKETILADRQSHASIIDAIYLAKSQKNIRMRYFKHNDPDDLSWLLSRSHENSHAMVIVDGVYSMEGDLARLPDIVPLCKEQGAVLMVDDAHGLGVTGAGRGTAGHFKCSGDVDLIMGTFSKSFASIGGFISGSKELIHWIQHFARPFIFSASLPPANTAAVSAVLDIIRKEPEHVQRVNQISSKMRTELKAMGYDTGESRTPIIPIRIGDQFRTVQAWKMLYEECVFTNVALPPAVPANASLLRTSYMATHTDEHLDKVLEAFKKIKSKLKPARFQSRRGREIP